MKCINCTKFIQCSLDKQADESKKESRRKTKSKREKAVTKVKKGNRR